MTSSPEKQPKRPAWLVGQNAELLHSVWGSDQRRELGERVDLHPEVWNGDPRHMPSRADEVEILFSTWGMPQLDAEMLDRLPRLRAVFYAAGSVKVFARPLLERNIRVFSAWAANAIPVAEFTVSQILFALKQGWPHYRLLRETAGPPGWRDLPITGNYGARIGLISLGMIGAKVVQLLKPFHVQCAAYDPFVGAEAMREMGVESSSLEDLFACSDVVTLHAPWLKETEGMITGKLLRAMKPYSTFINTARGALVREDEMVEVLRERPDLTAVLDVTHPEPPVAGSPLYTLTNVVLTPHIAGSKGAEVRRMADWMIEECEAWLNGRPVRYEVTRENFHRLA